MAEKNQVTIKAFTGMEIGTFNIESKTSKAITVITKKGEMIFDATTGKQTNAKNPRFANYIEMGKGKPAPTPPEPKGDAKKQGSKPAAGTAKGGSKGKKAEEPKEDDVPEA
jgi:hypothetical protein